MPSRHDETAARQAAVASTLGGAGAEAGVDLQQYNGNGNNGQHTDNSSSGPLGLSKPRFLTTHHAPRKRLLNKLQALITSPKRAIGHAERDGISSLAGGFKGRNKRDSFNEGNEPSKAYLQQLSSDLSVNSPPSSSAGYSQYHQQSPVSPGLNGNHAMGLPESTVSSTAIDSGRSHNTPNAIPIGQQSRRHSLKATPVKSDDKLYSSPPRASYNDAFAGSASLLQVPSNEEYDADATATAKPSPVAPLIQLDGPDDAASLKPPILLRPHLKLRIVTWNMHDSLPTGDLTELLGNPSASCAASNDTNKPTPLDPQHPIQPLSSGLDADSPYHLVVVGGQEVPVGYGGWSGPNWTEIIQKWLSGTVELPTVDALQSGREDEEAMRTNATAQSSIPMSPTTAHRDFLDKQNAESSVIPDESVTTSPSDGNSPTPHANELAEEQGNQEILGDFLARRTSAMQLHLPGGNDMNSAMTSPSMERTDSSSTTTTSRSIATSRSAHELPHGEGVLSTDDQKPTTASTTPGVASDQGAMETGQPQSPYVLVTKERLMGIYCSVWIHRSCAHLIQGSSTGTVTAGLLAGKLGNKGAACISLMIAETRMLFVCAHLAAHSDRSALRQANVRKIKEELVIDSFRDVAEPKREPRLPRGFSISRPTKARELTDKDANGLPSSSNGLTRRNSVDQDITEQFDYTFWFGDLNFRLDISRLHADFLIKEKKFETALTFDQLKPILKDEEGCFKGFSEAPITFAPSYKYDVLKLKRAKTLHRSNTVTSTSGPGISERRANKHMSAPPPSSATASRSNLAEDVLDEEEEELDNQSINDRGTISSSRASISSSYSGFDGTVADMDKETLANTNYNIRRSGGYFGTSIPSTPATDKVFEKAKSFFGLMRTRSVSNAEQSETPTSSNAGEETPSLTIQTDNLSDPAPDSRLLSPRTAIEGLHGNHRPGSSIYGSIDSRNPSPLSNSYNWSEVNEQFRNTSSNDEQALSRERRQSLDVIGGTQSTDAHAVTPASISVSPATSPRPRLRSMRSSNTIFSMTSNGPGKSMSSTVESQTNEQTSEQAVFDTSSKKRVQSWTDRILYKSTIKVVRSEDVLAELEPQAQSTTVAGSLISSLRGIKRNLRDHHDTSHDTGSSLQHSLSAPQAIAQATPSLAQRVSFQEANPDQVEMHGKMYQNHNASQSSLGVSQQGLKGRLDRLFHRRSSGCDRVGDVHPITGTPDDDRNPDKKCDGSDPAPTARIRLSRSSSTQSRRSKGRTSRKSPSERENLDRFGSEMQTVPEAASNQAVRTKPCRSYTSPLPSNHLGLSEVTPLPRLSLSNASLGSSTHAVTISPPLPSSSTSTSALTVKGIFSSRPRSQSDLSLPRDGQSVLSVPESVSLSRSGSAPDAKWRSQSQEQNDADAQSNLASRNIPTVPVEDAYIDHKKGFAFPNPFVRHNTHHLLPAPPHQDDTDAIQPSNSPPAVKTGIKLSLSKTTPVTSTVDGGSAQPTLGIRNWWNNRFKPHLFSFHHDSQSGDMLRVEDSVSGQADASIEALAPQPVILGPQRGEIQCISYDAVADLRRMEACSDHRPVVAVLAIGL